MDSKLQPPGSNAPLKVPGRGFVPGPSNLGLSYQKAKETVETFRVACLSKETPAERLDELASTLQNAGYREELTQVLGEALGAEEANPQVGALWIRRLVSSKSWKRNYPDYIDELCERGEIGRRAVLEFLQYLNTKSKPALICRLLSRHGKWVRKDTEAWSLAAGALAKAEEFSRTKSWTRDWRERPEGGARVLFARALALRCVKREREAHEVVQAALSMPGASEEYPVLVLWAAMEEGIAGQVEPGAAHFQQARQSGWDEDGVCLYYLVRGVIRVQQAAPEERAEAFHSSFARIEDRLRRRPVHRRHYLLRRAYRRCVCRMASDAGLVWRRLLTPWRSADSALTMLPLAVIPGLQLGLPVYLYRLLTRRHAPSR